MTPREFWNTCKGYNDRKEREYRENWEMSRWVGTMAYNVQNPKPKAPKRLLPFPWDREVEADHSDEIEKIKKYREWLR